MSVITRLQRTIKMITKNAHMIQDTVNIVITIMQDVHCSQRCGTADHEKDMDTKFASFQLVLRHELSFALDVVCTDNQRHLQA